MGSVNYYLHGTDCAVIHSPSAINACNHITCTAYNIDVALAIYIETFARQRSYIKFVRSGRTSNIPASQLITS